MTEPQNLSRRSFLVAAGSAILGSFVLPRIGQTSVLPSLEDTTTVLDAQIRRLVGVPHWNGHSFMMWSENIEGKDGKLEVKIMVWEPETEQELSEARLFYEAATKIGYRSFDELSAQHRQPGSWLVSWLIIANRRFLTTSDKSRLIPTPQPDSWDFCDNPQDAVILTHDEAIQLSIQLMQANGMEPPQGRGGGFFNYLIPVRLEEAKENYQREQRWEKARLSRSDSASH